MKAIVVGEFKPETRRSTFRDGSLTLWAARNEGVVNGKRQAKRPWILLMTPPGRRPFPRLVAAPDPRYTRRITIAHPGVAHQWERGVLCAPACGQPFPGQSYGCDGGLASSDAVDFPDAAGVECVVAMATAAAYILFQTL
jgi:hypothetical protein